MSPLPTPEDFLAAIKRAGSRATEADPPDEPAARALARDLLARWSAPERHYHQVAHLGECLDAHTEISRTGNLAARGVGELALWFHDAVYDPRAADNEERSALLAQRLLTGLGMPTAVVSQVATLVRATATHSWPAPGTVEAAVHDADLWILCAAPERFDEYCAQVRAEYAHVPEADFRTGRAAILRDLIERPRLYAQQPTAAVWEPRARANVARELARLEMAG